MDYVVGSVAALISGNVTPNRPKVIKRALTPMKHQPSPNVTPKSESVTDRSIFLSPTMQKKKAIVKKSPKRIFQNPDLDGTIENQGHSAVAVPSPKADKVKKHLKDELDADIHKTTLILSPKSPKNKMNKLVTSPTKKQLNISIDNLVPEEIQFSNESTPKKKKKKLNLVSESTIDDTLSINKCNKKQDNNSNVEDEISTQKYTPKKKRKSNAFTVETIESSEILTTETLNGSSVEKVDIGNKKINHKSNKTTKGICSDSVLGIDANTSVNKENEDLVLANKNRKKKKALKNVSVAHQSINEDNTLDINPNAITNQDTDSEHESDDDIESENEESNKIVLNTGSQESSDDDEETHEKPKKNNKENVKEHFDTEEEVKRTLFVGNVPFSNKCKKEIKKIFSKYGQIETVRIRTIPVKDGRVTPKLAVIKNELHPDRTAVNVYIRYAHPSSVNDALVENNTVLHDHHLRVARSDVTGSEHDPRCSVFVGNMPFALEDEALRAKFEKCGEIESVRIVRDRKTNAGKGFGYVNFASKDGVELALALTDEDLTFKNRILRVKRCTQSTTNQQTRQQSNRGRHHNYQGRQQHYQGRQQINRSGSNQFGNDRFQRRDQGADSKSDGAYRRIMKKRKLQENSEAPLEKNQNNFNQPSKEKKQRKEFVGITSDKKKFQKRKLNKDQKKKRALSEILSKQRQ